MLDKKLKARGLSAKLLLMTIGFVMLAESVLFIPSAAIYRQTWIMDRVQQAQILAQAITGVPNYKASEMLSKDFITQTDVELVALKKDGTTQLVLGAPPQTMDFITVDMTNPRLINRDCDYHRRTDLPVHGSVDCPPSTIIIGAYAGL